MPVQFELFIVIVACIGNGILGLFTYLKNPKSATNKLFFLFTLYIAIYNFVNFQALHQTDDASTLFWIRTVISHAYIINLLFYLFSHTFPLNKLSINRTKLFVISAVSLILIPLNYTKFVFESVKPSTTQPVPGPGIVLLLIHSILLLGLGFYHLVKKYRNSTGIQHTQFKLLILGTVIMFISILLSNLILVILFNTTTLVGLLPLYTLFFVAFVSYAIIKHRFMDMNFLVARTVSYSLLIGSLGFFYIMLFALSSLVISKSKEEAQFIAVSTVALSSVMTLTFQPIRRLLEMVTDKFFYKNRYNSNSLLYSTTHLMASTLSLEELTHSLLKEVLSQMKINHGAFILTENGKITQVAHEGYKQTPEFEENSIQLLMSQQSLMIFDELPEDDNKSIMRNMKIRISYRLRTEDKELGLLIFGEKLSGEIFSADDIRLLEIFAPQVAVAIENTKSYEEIRRFNITLKEEIDNATKDLQAANTRLKEVDRLKDEFVSLASHELRTPMTAIKSYLWLFLQSHDAGLNSKQQLYIERAYQSIDRLIALVNDMLNVSRIESGRMNLMIKACSMQTLIKEVIDELSPATQKQNVTLKFNYENNSLPMVMADQNKIREVLINLIGNSIKFTKPGGNITVNITIENDMLITRVTDTGKGIKQEDLSKLFHKFQTVGNNYLTKVNTQGTGLGLYLSKSIIELHGGKIWAESEGEGRGSTFSFSLKVDNRRQEQDTKTSQTFIPQQITNNTSPQLQAATAEN